MPRPRVVITAGGTAEPLDDVRVLTNRSSGRFGVALARAAVRAGADVTLVGAPSAADVAPSGARYVPFDTTASLVAALDEATAAPVDVMWMAAAVADYLPVAAPGKIRSDADHLDLHLTRAPKILPTLRARCGPGCRIVGFKLLSGVSSDALVEVARRQMLDNALDATVANDLRELSGDDHPCWLVGADGARRLEGGRDEVARALMEALLPHPPPHGLCELQGPRHGRVAGWWHVPGGIALDPQPGVGHLDALARRWRDPDASVAEPDDDGARLGGAAWDAALAARALASLPPGRPLLWRGEVVGAWDGATLTALRAPVGWARRLPVRGPLRLVGDPTPWRASGWWGPPEALMAPWLHPAPRRGASAVVLDGGRVLLGRRRVGDGSGLLAPPGGRIEPGEGVLAAALRELAEETGIDLRDTPHRVRFVAPTWAGGDPPWRVDAVVIDVLEPPCPRPSDEMDARWWPLDRALRHRELAPGAREVLDALPWPDLGEPGVPGNGRPTDRPEKTSPPGGAA